MKYGSNLAILPQAAVELQTFTAPIPSTPQHTVRDSDANSVRNSLHGVEEDSDDEDGEL